MKAKFPEDSKTIQTDVVLPADTNSLDNLFGGELLARMDKVASIAAIKSIIPEDASNLKNSLNGLVICWIIGTIYLYSGYLSIAKKV